MNEDKDEEQVRDPQAYITKFNFFRGDQADERTEVNTNYEQAWILEMLVMHEKTGRRIFRDIALTYMRLKISKDRKARIEAVDSLKATNDPRKGGFDTGLPIVMEAVEAQNRRDE